MRSPSLGLVLLCTAAPLAAHGDLDERIAIATKQIKKAPKDAKLYRKRAELHRLHKDWKAARNDYATARKLAPSLADLDFLEGRMEAQAKRLDVAVTCFTRELSRGPHLLAYLWRARTRVRKNELAKALRDYDAALKTPQPAAPDHYLERARLQQRMGHDAQRVAAGIDEGVSRLGPLISLHMHALEIELAAKDVDAALRRIDGFLPSLPMRSPWLLRRGKILASAKRIDAARRDFETGIRELASLPRTNAMQLDLLKRLREAKRALPKETR